MGFLGLFFIIILVILLFGITMLHGVIRLVTDAVMSLFGMSRRRNGTGQKTKENRYGTRRRHKAESSAAPSKKIFAKDEGEYVDFEEIKDP